MVAAGNDQGIVTVFQIPKNPPDSLPDSLKPKQKKQVITICTFFQLPIILLILNRFVISFSLGQVERYNIGGLHKKTVTTVEWSKNGMKLFSGDQDGLVVLTEIDFYMVNNFLSGLLRG